MRIFNADEFAYDVNESLQGYWLEREHPNIYKWVLREVPKLLQAKAPGRFKKISVKKSLVLGLRAKLIVEDSPQVLHVTSEYDLKDAWNGILFYYNSSIFSGSANLEIASLGLTPIIYWMIETQASADENWMKVTYEVAKAKQLVWERKKQAEANAVAKALQAKFKALQAEATELVQQEIWMPVSKDYTLLVFHEEHEFLKEGSTQSNCMYWHMYPRFKKNQTFCAGLRKASDPGTPFISIELDRHNFSLLQAEFGKKPDETRPQDASESEAVKVLMEFVGKNKELLKTVAKKLFDINEFRFNQSQERAPGSELRFTVRL